MRKTSAIVTIAILGGLVGCVSEVVQDRRGGVRTELPADRPSMIDTELKRLREKVDRFPDLVNLHLRIAYLLASKEEYEEAADELETAIAKVPDNPRFHFELGRTYQQMGKWARAEECYRRVLGLCPDARYTGPHMFLGFALAMQDQYGDALEQFEHALTIDPELADAHYWIGSINDMQGNREAAIRAWEHYLKLGGPYSRQVYERLQALMRVTGMGLPASASSVTEQKSS